MRVRWWRELVGSALALLVGCGGIAVVDGQGARGAGASAGATSITTASGGLPGPGACEVPSDTNCDGTCAAEY